MYRRDFGKTAASIAFMGSLGIDKSEAKTPDKFTDPKDPYGIQYYKKATDIWKRESTEEIPKIAEAAQVAAKCLKGGGKLYEHAMFGHMLTSECRKDRPGNPGYMGTWGWDVKDEEFDPIGKGDFLFFDFTKPRIKAAHDRGAFVVGARVPYLPNRLYPKGVQTTLEMAGNLLTEDCSDIVLTSGAPFTNGVLYVPEIPAVRPCPISVQGVGNFHWMLSAEIAFIDKGGTVKSKGEKALEYINLIKSRGAKIKGDFSHIDSVARAMAEYVAKGGAYLNYSHGCEMDAENLGRASGIAMTQRVQPDKLDSTVKSGDFAIISGEHSDIKENYNLALALKSKGVKIITIGPSSTEGSSGNDLSKVADWHIETYSPERYGAISVPGFDRKICPTTGILFALALWMTNAQFIYHMIQQDMTPGIDMGGHILGGNAYNAAVRPIVKARGY